jgi:guanine deaminase
MDLLEASGLITYVGKVNMDRNAAEYLCEVSAEQSAKDTKDFIREASGRYQRTKPILTPRFIPSCTDELMGELKILQHIYSVPMQSHLSENLAEVAWVKELIPTASSYAAAYDDFGLFGREVPTIMAHCVYNTPEEIALMKQNKVYVAHCPESNLNLASGIAPIRNYIRQELKIGLGTDVAGGSSLSLLKAMAHAIQASKLYWRLMDQTMEPLTFAEVFYLATLGGGSFFGKVGSFLEGYEFDAVVLDDSNIRSVRPCYGIERVERLMYLSEGYQVYEKYVGGRKIL